MLSVLISMTERGLIPDPLVRLGIRQLCGQRLRSLQTHYRAQPGLENQYVEMLKTSPVAVATDAANEQHYEVPAEFFATVLGPHRKYSCAYWPEGCRDLATAELLALDETMRRAELRDGMKILELGCGWGSLTLAMASRFPASRVLAISNSQSQRQFIEGEARRRGLQNIEIRTCDVSALESLGDDEGSFDRVVSVEMFEHFRNYEILLQRIHRWLNPEGKLFVHIFTHRQYPYLFETEGSDNWMGKYFFTGGQMPSHDLMKAFQRDLKLEKQWAWDGTHYQKTSEAWLQNHDREKERILTLFEKVYGPKEAQAWFHRWRIFFLSVAELFGYRQGQEWGVSHYLFSKKGS